jgi:hypothetical protein
VEQALLGLRGKLLFGRRCDRIFGLQLPLIDQVPRLLGTRPLEHCPWSLRFIISILSSRSAIIITVSDSLARI